MSTDQETQDVDRELRNRIATAISEEFHPYSSEECEKVARVANAVLRIVAETDDGIEEELDDLDEQRGRVTSLIFRVGAAAGLAVGLLLLLLGQPLVAIVLAGFTFLVYVIWHLFFRRRYIWVDPDRDYDTGWNEPAERDPDTADDRERDDEDGVVPADQERETSK